MHSTATNPPLCISSRIFFLSTAWIVRYKMQEQSYLADMPITMDSIIIDSPQLADGTFEYEDESYFFQTYVPLSSFPTPPPSTSDGGTRPQSSASCEDFQELEPLLGMYMENTILTSVTC